MGRARKGVPRTLTDVRVREVALTAFQSINTHSPSTLGKENGGNVGG